MNTPPPNDNLIKNSAFVAISNNISLLQRKLFNYLLAFAYPKLANCESFSIDLNFLVKSIGFNSHNLHYLKNALKSLLWSVVEFNLLSKDKDSWSATTLLSWVEIKKWVCEYSFSPLLRKKLYQPNIYAKIKLSMMLKFSSKYSLALYELLVDYQTIEQTPIIGLNDFRKLMWLQSHQYQEFKRLSTRVIKPAIDELESLGYCRASIIYTRENRRIVALKFKFKQLQSNKNRVLDDKVLHYPVLENKLVKEFWLTQRQAQKTIKEFPVPYIKESLLIIKHQIKKQTIKNIPAYTLTVLKNDYTTISNIKEKPLLWDSPNDGREREKREWTHKYWLENSKNPTSMNLLCDKNDNNLSQMQKKAFKHFQTLKKEEQQRIIKKFESQKIKSDILKTLYEKKGLDDVLFKSMFVNFLS